MRMFYTIAFVTLSCVACFGQSSYKGLTPGQSTRADVERVLGQPQKRISATLVEYSGGADATKIYVQFADESVAAEALRIELFCEGGSGAKDQRGGCAKLYDRLVPEHHSNKGQRVRDAYIMREPDAQWSYVNYEQYHGPPFFVVYKFRQGGAGGEELGQWRIGLYSRELYENAVPKSCTGTFVDVWETSRGRVTFIRTPHVPAPKNYSATKFINIQGTYTTGNGTMIGNDDYDVLDGEWKDATGGGTMQLKFVDGSRKRSFTGTWQRTSGSGPVEGTWEGRCVETKGGASGTN